MGGGKTLSSWLEDDCKMFGISSLVESSSFSQLEFSHLKWILIVTVFYSQNLVGMCGLFRARSNSMVMRGVLVLCF